MRLDASVSVTPFKTLATDELEEPEWKRPTRLPYQANASVSADRTDAPEPRPQRSSRCRPTTGSFPGESSSSSLHAPIAAAVPIRMERSSCAVERAKRPDFSAWPWRHKNRLTP